MPVPHSQPVVVVVFPARSSYMLAFAGGSGGLWRPSALLVVLAAVVQKNVGEASSGGRVMMMDVSASVFTCECVVSRDEEVVTAICCSRCRSRHN
jgi:hypothetical protein